MAGNDTYFFEDTYANVSCLLECEPKKKKCCKKFKKKGKSNCKRCPKI